MNVGLFRVRDGMMVVGYKGITNRQYPSKGVDVWKTFIDHHGRGGWVVNYAAVDEGFRAHVYHSTDAESDVYGSPKQKSQQPILFLSRLLTDVESRYWPTELEIAGLVWVDYHPKQVKIIHKRTIHGLSNFSWES